MTNIHSIDSPRNVRAEKSSSDWFTRDRFRWWDALAADHEMPPAAFAVGYAIGTALRRDSGNTVFVSASNRPDDVICEAWIGADALAAKIGMSTATVFAMVRKLEQHGYIEKDPGKRGSGHAHHYRLIEKGQPADISKDQPADISDEKGQPADISGTENVSPLTIKCQPADMNPLSPLKEISLEEKDSAGLDLGVDDAGRRSDAKFEEFYRQYPKRVAKAAALRAYRTVITKKLATPEQLLAGVLRYAAERTGQDPRYTKHPATWLNSGCWADEAAAPEGSGAGVHSVSGGVNEHIAQGVYLAQRAQARRLGNGC